MLNINTYEHFHISTKCTFPKCAENDYIINFFLINKKIIIKNLYLIRSSNERIIYE